MSIFGSKEEEAPVVYAIAGWWDEKGFENSLSRRYPRISQVSVPNRMDGKGFRRLARQGEDEPDMLRIAVFGAFMLMVEIASKLPVRGLLEDEDGPLTPVDYSDKSCYPEMVFSIAITLLSDPQIGWLVPVSDKIRLRYELEQHKVLSAYAQNKSQNRLGFLDKGKGVKGKGIEKEKGGRPLVRYPKELDLVIRAKESALNDLRNKYDLQHASNRKKYPSVVKECEKLETAITACKKELADMA